MIEVEVKEGSESEYPCLMTSDKGIIVLFSGDGIGTVVRSDYHSLGDYGEGWDMNYFSPFTGSITLRNK